MRIFIQTYYEERYPLEAESNDTVDYVKGLIGVKEGLCRWEQRLVFGDTQLEDSKTLADYYIQNDSIIRMAPILRDEGRMPINIKTSFNHYEISVESPDSTINDVKAVIEEAHGIPVNEQTLMFSDEELDGGRTLRDYRIQRRSTLRLVRLRDADEVVDVAAVKAWKKKTLLKDKETENQDEVVPKVPEVGSKRAREDTSSETPPRPSERDLSSCGANRVQGLESFWAEKDFGLAWRRSRYLICSYDTSRFESKSHCTLIESVANDCVRTLNVTAFLGNQLKEYQEELSKVENELKELSERNFHLENSLYREKQNFWFLAQELHEECSTGTSFLQSEVGQRHIVSLERQAAKSAVDDFKNGYAIKKIVKDRAMSVYEDAVKECQRLLRKSGLVSEDIIQLIGPQDEVEEEPEDDEVEEPEDDRGGGDGRGQ